MINPKDINQFLYSLYQDVSPIAISIACRKKHQLYDNKAFVYGESHLPSLYDIFSEVNPKPGEVFYDLGSGSGRVVLYAALNFPFAKCRGVELLDDLFNLAQTKLKSGKERLVQLPDFDQKNFGEIKFINSDFTKADISNANVIYITSTCFDQKLLTTLASHIEQQVAPGTRIISLTKSLPAETLKLVKSKSCSMEWGPSTAFFHEKI